MLTGAARGIGAETARHLAKLGAKLSIVDLNKKELSQVGNEITKSGGQKPLEIVADVSKDAQRIIDETVKHFGRLDVLVNIAGIFGADSVIEFDETRFDRIMNVNVRSMIILTNLAVPHLEKSKGNVINISSISGSYAFAEFMSYSISKAAVDQFTKSSARALAPKGIRVNAIAPGIIQTPIYAAIGQTADSTFEAYKDKCLVKRPGEPSEVAAGIAYLATQPFVDGIILHIDGGFLCAN